MSSPPPQPQPSEAGSSSAKKPQKSMKSRYDMSPIVFQVNDQTFKVPRLAFVTESLVFQNHYPLPYGDEPDAEPVILKDVQEDDFDAFLKVLYPVGLSVTESGVRLELTIGEWTSVLILAHRWVFLKIRDLAISELQRLGLDPVTKIELGRQCNLPGWLYSGVEELVTRETTTLPVLSKSEGEKLGVSTVIDIYTIRDMLAKEKPRERDVRKAIEEIFPNEVKRNLQPTPITRAGTSSDLSTSSASHRKVKVDVKEPVMVRGARSGWTRQKNGSSGKSDQLPTKPRVHPTTEEAVHVELTEVESMIGGSSGSSSRRKESRFKRIKDILKS